MESENPKTIDLSVIIVSWNTRQTTCDCLKSIFEQSIKLNYEVIIVDNNSSDDSVENIKKQFPSVKLICNKENLGFAKANNIGINASNGKYVCLVNSDIILLDRCFEKLIDFMDNEGSVGLAGPHILNVDGSLQVSCRTFPSIWNNLCQTIGLNYLFPRSPFFSEPFMKYWAHDEDRKVDVLSGCFWIVRREALNKIGLLDESFFMYGEDIDWCKRFHQAGWDVMFYANAKAIHLGGASSNNAPIRFYIEMEKADLQFWKKHHGKLAETAYKVLLIFRHFLRLISGVLQYVFSVPDRKTAQFKLRRNIACLHHIFKKSFKVGM